MKKYVLVLVLTLPLVAFVASAQTTKYSPNDYIQTTHEPATFSKAEITGGEVFYATIKSRGVAIKDLPFPSKAGRYSYRFIAKNKASGEQQVLNSFFGVRVEPFPLKKGESYGTSDAVPLQFPDGSKAGDYAVIEELTGMEMKAPELGWQNALDPSGPLEPRSIGAVKYSPGKSPSTDGFAPTPTPAPASATTPTATPHLPLSSPISALPPEPAKISSPKPTPSPVLMVSALTVMPDSVEGGTSLVGTVTLNKPASDITFGGTIVWLSATPGVPLSLPQNIKVKAGATSSTFSIRTNKVKSPTRVPIVARLNNVAKTAVVTINPPSPPTIALSSLTVTPDSVVNGATAVGKVKLDTAPSSDQVVRLSATSGGSLTLPASVIVRARTTSGSFSILTRTVTSSIGATITATLNSSQKTAQLTINPPPLVVSFLTVTPDSVISGSTAVGKVALNRAAPADGQTVKLSVGPSGFLPLPASTTVQAGETSGTFNIPTVTVDSPKTVTIAATLNNSQKVALLTINPIPTACFYACRPAILGTGGWSAKCGGNETAQPWMTCPKTTQSYRCGTWGTRTCSAQVDSICCKPK